MRWLDRCIEAHKSSGRTHKQNLFAIIQGGLDPDLRDKCLDAMVQRKDDVPGYAVGGLSGGEEKDIFWRMCVFRFIISSRLLGDRMTSRISQCTSKLPEDSEEFLTYGHYSVSRSDRAKVFNGNRFS